ncbi:hypothetical protein [Variovorax gossypii]
MAPDGEALKEDEEEEEAACIRGRSVAHLRRGLFEGLCTGYFIYQSNSLFNWGVRPTIQASSSPSHPCHVFFFRRPAARATHCRMG